MATTATALLDLMVHDVKQVNWGGRGGGLHYKRYVIMKMPSQKVRCFNRFGRNTISIINDYIYTISDHMFWTEIGRESLERIPPPKMSESSERRLLLA